MKKYLFILLTILNLYSSPLICANTPKDTITSNTVQKFVIIEGEQNGDKESDKMPWIVALVIGIGSAIINIIIAFIQRSTNRKGIKQQMEIAKLEFNRSVKSHNRQEWINLLRNLISEIDIKIMTLVFRPVEKTSENIMKITLLQNKIELMLNQDKEEHKKLFEALTTLIKKTTNPTQNVSSDEHKDLRKIYFDSTKKVLKMEWERVKKGE